MVFDTLASSYDQDFTASPIARALRGRAHARLIRHLGEGDHVLELGCGTGEDALFLAHRGIRVTATDASEQMLAVARSKAADHSLIQFEKLDLRSLPERASLRPAPTTEHSLYDRQAVYDGVFANFGVLNCLDDWRPTATWLAEQVKPGGLAAFGVMSPLCLWEMAWHGLHGDFGTASRRLRRHTTFQPADGGSVVPIRYPTVRRLTRDFAPYFRRTHVEPLGLFLPPSDVYGVIERRPRLHKTLTALDSRTSALAPLALFADHYWIEFIRAAR